MASDIYSHQRMYNVDCECTHFVFQTDQCVLELSNCEDIVLSTTAEEIATGQDKILSTRVTCHTSTDRDMSTWMADLSHIRMAQ